MCASIKWKKVGEGKEKWSFSPNMAEKLGWEKVKNTWVCPWNEEPFLLSTEEVLIRGPAFPAVMRNGFSQQMSFAKIR